MIAGIDTTARLELVTPNDCSRSHMAAPRDSTLKSDWLLRDWADMGRALLQNNTNVGKDLWIRFS